MTYSKPEPLRREHKVEGFVSGDESLDNWLPRHALQAQAGGSARVFVATDDTRVVGYYALAAGHVLPGDATARLLKGQPALRPIPVILLARLAVDRHHQGQGLGRSLLWDAMLRSEGASQTIGARAIVAHAANEGARNWYLRYSFEDSPTDPLHLILLMKDLKLLLEEG